MKLLSGLSQRVQEAVAYYKEQGAEVTFVEQDLAQFRMNMCKGCDRFWPNTKQCGKCKCFLEVKTRLKYDPIQSARQMKPVKTHCPLLKW